MDNKRLTPKESKKLPYNYSQYPVEELSKDDLIKKDDKLPFEFCKTYNATLFVRGPYKKIIEY